MHPVTTSRAPGLRASASANATSIDSWRAASMNAHVFTTIRSASAGESAGSRPSPKSDATTLSESTAFLGQPSVSTWKRRPVFGADIPNIVPTGPLGSPAVEEATLWCPSCGAEYEVGSTQCRDCRVALVSERPPGLDEDDAADSDLVALGEWP